MCCRPSRNAATPQMDRRDVGLVVEAVPEVAERRAALVRRKAAPQKLAAHLVIEADEERLDEARVGLEQEHEVVRNVVRAGQEHVAVVFGELVAHRLVQLRIRHHAVEEARQHEPRSAPRAIVASFVSMNTLFNARVAGSKREALAVDGEQRGEARADGERGVGAAAHRHGDRGEREIDRRDLTPRLADRVGPQVRIRRERCGVAIEHRGVAHRRRNGDGRRVLSRP